MTQYALYKGEECISIGTIYNIAKQQGVKYDTIMYYGTNAYKKKLAKRKNKNARELICLDD